MKKSHVASRPFRVALFAAAAIGLTTAVASAVPLALSNFSFETPDVTPFAYNPNDDAAPGGGWDFTPGLAGITNQREVFAGDADGGTNASDGEQIGFLQRNSEVAQNVGGATAGQRYFVAVDAGGRDGNAPDSSRLSIEVSDVAGGNSFVVLAPTVIPTSAESDPNDPSQARVLTTYEASFVNPVGFGSQFRVRLIQDDNGSGLDVTTLIDNVRIGTDSVVPEPTTLAALAAAGALLGRRRTRRA